MDKKLRNLAIFGSVLTLSSIFILGKIGMYRHHKCVDKNPDKSIYKKLQESKMALAKASLVIQSALEEIEHDNKNE